MTDLINQLQQLRNKQLPLVLSTVSTSEYIARVGAAIQKKLLNNELEEIRLEFTAPELQANASALLTDILAVNSQHLKRVTVKGVIEDNNDNTAALISALENNHYTTHIELDGKTSLSRQARNIAKRNRSPEHAVVFAENATPSIQLRLGKDEIARYNAVKEILSSDLFSYESESIAEMENPLVLTPQQALWVSQAVQIANWFGFEEHVTYLTPEMSHYLKHALPDTSNAAVDITQRLPARPTAATSPNVSLSAKQQVITAANPFDRHLRVIERVAGVYPEFAEKITFNQRTYLDFAFALSDISQNQVTHATVLINSDDEMTQLAVAMLDNSSLRSLTIEFGEQQQMSTHIAKQLAIILRRNAPHLATLRLPTSSEFAFKPTDFAIVSQALAVNGSLTHVEIYKQQHTQIEKFLTRNQQLRFAIDDYIYYASRGGLLMATMALIYMSAAVLSFPPAAVILLLASPVLVVAGLIIGTFIGYLVAQQQEVKALRALAQLHEERVTEQRNDQLSLNVPMTVAQYQAAMKPLTRDEKLKPRTTRPVPVETVCKNQNKKQSAIHRRAEIAAEKNQNRVITVPMHPGRFSFFAQTRAIQSALHQVTESTAEDLQHRLKRAAKEEIIAAYDEYRATQRCAEPENESCMI